MNLVTAIALSSGNKAMTYDDKGKRIVVQERYSGPPPGTSWWHLWFFGDEGVTETDIDTRHVHQFEGYSVDPNAKYWIPL